MKMKPQPSIVLTLLCVFIVFIVFIVSCKEPIEPELDVTQSAANLVVHPDDPSSTTGTSLQLTVKRRYPDDVVSDVTDSVTYAIEDGIGTVTQHGLVTAGGEANPIIIRIADTESDATVITSVPVVAATAPLLLAIAVNPNPATVAVGQTAQLRAAGLYTDGSSKDLSAVVKWSTSRADIVTVDQQGLVGGVAAGDATVTATSADNAATLGSAAVKVVP